MQELTLQKKKNIGQVNDRGRGEGAEMWVGCLFLPVPYRSQNIFLQKPALYQNFKHPIKSFTMVCLS